jgi:hypothetical protein
MPKKSKISVIKDSWDGPSEPRSLERSSKFTNTTKAGKIEPHTWLSREDPQFRMIEHLKDMLLPLISKKPRSMPASRTPPQYNPAIEFDSPYEADRKIWYALEDHASEPDVEKLRNSESRALIQHLRHLTTDPHRVGASLYILQHMCDVRRDKEAGLNKAYWLFAWAPLTEDAPFRKREDPKGFGRFWRKHYEKAQEWAAFAVLTQTPLQLRNDSLHQFLKRHPDEFETLTRDFLKFRHHFMNPRSNAEKAAAGYIKRGLPQLPPDTEESSTQPRAATPDMLSTYQWSILEKYSSDREATPTDPR